MRLGGIELAPKRWRSDRIIFAMAVGSSWGVAIVLLVSGMRHMSNPYYFLGTVYSYGIVGPGVGQIVAVTLPMLQITVGVCLLAQVLKDAALYAAIAMFGLFVFVQSWAWWQGLGIECGCFGASYELDTIGLTSVAGAVGGMLLTGVAILCEWPGRRKTETAV